MTAPIRRPDEWRTLGDHEQRVRILEAICCGLSGTGFSDAVEIRDRAFSWYGMGDTEDMTCSECITNYGTGADGNFDQGDDCDFGSSAAVGGAPPCGTGSPSTPGPNIQWPLCQDNASYQGCGKRYCAVGGYPATPFCSIGDALEAGADWSFNLWVTWGDYSTICDPPSDVISYGSGGLFGYRDSGGGGLFLATIGASQFDIDPPPAPIIGLHYFDGSINTDIPIYDGASTLVWQMITVTWEFSTMTLRVYHNGALIGSDVVTATQGIVAGNITIGTLNFGGFLGASYGGWDGTIDEVGLWAECLTGSDVATLYFAGTPPPPVVASDIDSGDSTCGEPLCSDGVGGAEWGNPCRDEPPFVMPAVGVVTVQDVVDALIGLGLVTQGS